MMPIISTNNQGFFPSIFNDFNDFNSFFNDNWLMPHFHSTSPAINVSEDEKEYKVEVAAPGMTKDDFKISLSDGDIVLSMEKKSSNDNNDADANVNQKKYIRREFSYSKFEQRLALPDNVEAKDISAKMNDGVLNIILPKKKVEEVVPETKFIEIK